MVRTVSTIRSTTITSGSSASGSRVSLSRGDDEAVGVMALRLATPTRCRSTTGRMRHGCESLPTKSRKDTWGKGCDGYDRRLGCGGARCRVRTASCSRLALRAGGGNSRSRPGCRAGERRRGGAGGSEPPADACRAWAPRSSRNSRAAVVSASDYAPKFTYAPEVLPAIAEALEANVRHALPFVTQVVAGIDRAAAALTQ